MKKVSSISISILLLILVASVLQAQTAPASSATHSQRPLDGSGRSDEESQVTPLEEEMRVKREIMMAEKDHKQNLERAREIAEIGKQLTLTLKARATLDRSSLKKIDRLEKLTKKIRGEAGGEDEDVSISDKPTDLLSAIGKIAETSEALSKNVQDTPRQVVSAAVIGNANVLLELIKIARSMVKP